MYCWLGLEKVMWLLAFQYEAVLICGKGEEKSFKHDYCKSCATRGGDCAFGLMQ